mgnify:CR=1 FL=1
MSVQNTPLHFALQLLFDATYINTLHVHPHMYTPTLYTTLYQLYTHYTRTSCLALMQHTDALYSYTNTHMYTQCTQYTQHYTYTHYTHYIRTSSNLTNRYTLTTHYQHQHTDTLHSLPNTIHKTKHFSRTCSASSSSSLALMQHKYTLYTLQYTIHTTLYTTLYTVHYTIHTYLLRFVELLLGLDATHIYTLLIH